MNRDTEIMKEAEDCLRRGHLVDHYVVRHLVACIKRHEEEAARRNAYDHTEDERAELLWKTRAESAEAEVVRLREDKERVDLLQKMCDAKPDSLLWIMTKPGLSVRAAIDDTRAVQKYPL